MDGAVDEFEAKRLTAAPPDEVGGVVVGIERVPEVLERRLELWPPPPRAAVRASHGGDPVGTRDGERAVVDGQCDGDGLVGLDAMCEAGDRADARPYASDAIGVGRDPDRRPAGAA